jgi:hypothetical protein
VACVSHCFYSLLHRIAIMSSFRSRYYFIRIGLLGKSSTITLYATHLLTPPPSHLLSSPTYHSFLLRSHPCPGQGNIAEGCDSRPHRRHYQQRLRSALLPGVVHPDSRAIQRLLHLRGLGVVLVGVKPADTDKCVFSITLYLSWLTDVKVR